MEKLEIGEQCNLESRREKKLKLVRDNILEDIAITGADLKYDASHQDKEGAEDELVNFFIKEGGAYKFLRDKFPSINLSRLLFKNPQEFFQAVFPNLSMKRVFDETRHLRGEWGKRSGAFYGPLRKKDGYNSFNLREKARFISVFNTLFLELVKEKGIEIPKIYLNEIEDAFEMANLQALEKNSSDYSSDLPRKYFQAVASFISRSKESVFPLGDAQELIAKAYAKYREAAESIRMD
jgi:hypothetical protein